MFDDVLDSRGETINASAWNNNCVSAAVGFLRNTKKFTPVVLAEFDVEMLPFDLQLPGFDEIIHACKKPRSLGRILSKREAVFSG